MRIPSTSSSKGALLKEANYQAARTEPKSFVQAIPSHDLHSRIATSELKHIGLVCMVNAIVAVAFA